jgi:hypothetical protein
MSDQLELKLPRTAPSAAAWRTKSILSSKAALYSLVDFTDAELQELQKVCESQCEPEMQKGAIVSLAPRASLANQALRAVFDYHLELAIENEFYPTLFIVAVDRDWKSNGVLLVTLDDEDEPEGNVDYFRIKTRHSGLIFANLEVGNSDWMEEKETYEIKAGQGDTNTDDEAEKDEEEDEDGPDAPSRFDDPGSPTSGPIPPKRPHPWTGGDYKGIYIISGLNPTEVINKLTPGASYMDIKPENYHIRLQAVIPAASPDPIAEALSLHASRCAKNPFLDKLFFLLVDTQTPEIDGVALVCTGGVVKGDDIPAGATQRGYYSDRMTFQNIYCNLVNSVRVWAPRDLTFGVFTYDTGKEDRYGKVAKVLDPDFNKRVEADERILFAPFLEPGDFTRKGSAGRSSEYSFEEALRLWPRWCWEERFRQKFPRNFFICVDNDDSEKKGVLLVRVEWDGDTSGKLERMDDVKLHDTAEVWRVPVKEAYTTLKDVVEGTRQWEGNILE